MLSPNKFEIGMRRRRNVEYITDTTSTIKGTGGYYVFQVPRKSIQKVIEKL